MLEIKITTPSDIESNLDKILKLSKRPKGTMRKLGRSLSNAFREHFENRNNVSNKRGFKKSGYWAKVRRSTYLADYDDGLLQFLLNCLHAAKNPYLPIHCAHHLLGLRHFH